MKKENLEIKNRLDFFFPGLRHSKHVRGLVYTAQVSYRF